MLNVNTGKEIYTCTSRFENLKTKEKKYFTKK